MIPQPEAIVVTCIDFRLQEKIEDWISKNFFPKTYDRVAIAGNVKDIDTVIKQVSIAKDLHNVKKVVFMSHEDCGAYGSDGVFTKHVHDLTQAKKKVHELYPDLEVETYYMHLDGTVEVIN